MYFKLLKAQSLVFFKEKITTNSVLTLISQDLLASPDNWKLRILQASEASTYTGIKILVKLKDFNVLF